MSSSLPDISIPIPFDSGSISFELITERDNSLFEIDPQEAIDNGEASIQILEGNSYEYVLPEGYCLDTIAGIVSRSKKNKNRGRITPNIYVGTLTVHAFHDAYPDVKQPVKLEVLATKFDTLLDKSYRINYRKMLEDITSKSTDLLLQSGTPVSQNFEVDYSVDNRTLYQRFCFVRSVIDSKEFNEAIARIIASPKTSWKEEFEEVDVRKVRRHRAGEIRQLVARGNRIKLPKEHPLQSYGLTSVPRRVSTSKKTDTVDNPENRFIKHVLQQFLQFVEHCRDVFPKDSREKLEAKTLVSSIDSHLSHEFFKEVSRPTSLAMNNPVLQRRSGYREVLRSWLMFDLAAKMIWSGGQDVYEGGKRDIAVLYEYWLFFTLYDLFKQKFRINQHGDDEGKLDHLFKADKSGINLILKSGKHIALEGTCTFGNRSLNIKFSYNRTFVGGSTFSTSRRAGSWTTSLRPDYTISFWPAELREKQAEEREEIVHIHFDAKYKVAQFTVNESDNQDDLDKEDQDERKGIYKNPDLLKMHAYKDAIRRTSGAYVLYPGTEKREFLGFHEIIPGLGAFAINPSDEAKGVKNVSDFIDKVVENLLNRSSQREQMSTHLYRIHEDKPTDKLLEPFPEYINGEKVLPNETTVVIGYYKSEAHLNWILSNKLYNFRTGTRTGSMEMTPENIGALFLVLYGKGEIPTKKVFKLKKGGPKIYSKADLQSSGYPNTKGELYIVYEIDTDMSQEFNNAAFDLTKIEGFKSSPIKYGPVTVTLNELYKSKV